ncbi:response regulator [Rhodoferax ferrireducens]|uniref:response regulator n=1 Tax=Rhodoferax ferrireducens TaxID=192843 RepID=UPI003BB7C28D
MGALLKVLVVDDDVVVGKSFKRVLSDKGYIVTTAENAHEALKQIREQEFDVVFTDIKMPGMDGVELAERVKASRPWTPVVIITGYGTAENEVRAKAAGVSDFMRKPLSPEMIEESAAHALLKPALTVVPTLQASPVEPLRVEVPEQKSNFWNIALFLAAPFIGLAYAVFLPLVGLAMLAWIGGKALLQTQAAKKTPAYLRNVALFAFAPFIGLTYAIMLPFVGTAMLLWVGAKALMETKQTA